MREKIKIEHRGGHVEGYGGPGYYWSKGIWDNRLLWNLKDSSDFALGKKVAAAEEKWRKKKKLSIAAFKQAAARCGQADPICCSCGKPSQRCSSCLDNYWCDNPKCRNALEDARKNYEDNRTRALEADAQNREDQKLKAKTALDAITATSFHWRNGWYFKRLPDGAVRIIHRDSPSREWADTDITISASEWASIVCSVSELGESNGRWDEHLKFHGAIP